MKGYLLWYRLEFVFIYIPHTRCMMMKLNKASNQENFDHP
jgi:hypothetical protein